MRSFKVDGVSARTPTVGPHAFVAAPCDLLMRIEAKSAAACIKRYEKLQDEYPFDGLSVSEPMDLGFLTKFPRLRYLEILGDTKVKAEVLAHLDNLRGLYIEGTKAELNFAAFPLLEHFIGMWNPKFSNMGACQELRTLQLGRFNPKSGDLSPLSELVRLERLELVRPGIHSFRGYEGLEDLRYLSVHLPSKLQSLDQLGKHGAELRELSLSGAKRVQSMVPLEGLRKLRRLKLTDCGDIPNLEWIRALLNLDFFSFVGTSVTDGSLAPLLALPKLSYVGAINKKHYSPSLDDIEEALDER